MKKQWLIVMMTVAALFSANCSGVLGSDDDNNDDELAAFALLAATGLAGTAPCTLGGTTFTNVGTTCAGTVAAGSGTLPAASLVTDDLSVELTFTLNSASSSVFLIGGANPSNDLAVNSNPELQITPTVSKQPADSAAGAAGATAGITTTWCVEIHLDETPAHVILDQSSCSFKATSSTTYDDDDTASAINNGGRWGFVINDASISALTINDSLRITD